MPRPTRAASLLALLGVVTLATAASAQEWTRYRGPNGTGISAATTIPVTVGPADINWKAALPGTGHSSPVVSGKKLFVTSAEKEKGVRHLLCLDTATGKTLWSRQYPFAPYRTHQFNNFAAGSPCVDAQRVYTVWTESGKVTAVCVDQNGKDVWTRELGKHESQHGGAISPVLVEGTLIVANDQDGEGSFIAGLDPQTGAVRWKRARNIGNAASYAVPSVYTPKGGKPELIILASSHGVTSLDPITGMVNWEQAGLFQQRTVGSPTMHGDLIFATTGNGAGDRLMAAVQAGSKEKAPEVKYRLGRGTSYVPTPVVYNGLLFFWGDGGIVACHRAGTGEQLWLERVGGNFFGSPVCINGKLYNVSARGELVVIDAAEQFKLQGKSELGEGSHATPAVSGGVLYIHTESQLFSIGGAK